MLKCPSCRTMTSHKIDTRGKPVELSAGDLGVCVTCHSVLFVRDEVLVVLTADELVGIEFEDPRQVGEVRETLRQLRRIERSATRGIVH